MISTSKKPSGLSAPPPRGTRAWLLMGLLAITYLLAARASLSLAFAGTNASPIWPPSGLAFAGLILLGTRAFPAITLGAFAANVWAFAAGPSGLSVTTIVMSGAIAVGNTLEAVLGAFLVRRYAVGGRSLERVGDVGRFALVTALVCVVSALTGTATLALGGVVPSSALDTILLTWWFGDVTGILVVTPFLMSWTVADPLRGAPRAQNIALLLATLTIAWCTFSGVLAALPAARLMIYAAIPLLALGAFYFGHRCTTTVSLMWSGAAVWGTIDGRGPFASGPLNDSLILLDTFVALCSMTGLMLATDRREARRQRDDVSRFAAFAPSWGALLGCLAVTILAWHVITSDTERRANDRFGFRFAEIQRRIEERLVAYQQILWGCVGLFEASSEVTRDEWSAYIRAQRLGTRFPGIQGVGYAVVLPAEHKLTHEQAVRAQGHPSYAIHPAGARDPYTAIVFIEPFDWRNRRAFGFDMLAEPVRRSAMERARDSGRAAASGRVRLLQETDRDTQAGFLMYVPHYRTGEQLESVEARRKALTGYVYSPFRMHDLLRAILLDELKAVSLEIFDGEETTQDAELFSSLPDRSRADPSYRNPFVHTSVSIVGQRPWTLRATSQPSYEREVDRQKAQIVLFAGATLSLLFFVMVRTLAFTRERALELADEMTAALKDAETRFTSLANAASEGIVLLDTDGSITAWNPGAAAMFEAPESDMRGASWLMLVPERDRVTAVSLWTKLLEDAHAGVARSISVLGRARSGREFPLEFSLCSWLSKERRMYGLIVRDISERERAAEFFRSMFDEGPEAILVASELGRIVRANSRASQLFGYSEEEFLARHIEEVLPRWFHSTLPSTGERRAMSSGLVGDVFARRADGGIIPVDVSLSHLKLSGGGLMMATIVDITERKLAAEHLHATLALQSAILDSAAIAIIAFDSAGIILSFNRAAERMLGYLERDVVNTQTLAILHRPNELAARAEQLERELGSKVPGGVEVFIAAARAGHVDEGEWTYVRKDGSTFPVQLSVTALRDLTGEVSGFLAVAADISERKQREQEVQAALREKETLLKEVYHRVKNNLQVVSSLFNLQLRALPEGAARDSLLEGAARVRAMALVHEQLYQSANLSSIQLGNYIGDLCTQLAAAAAASHRGIALELALDRVDAGPELAVPLGLLLNELVSNSLKHGFPEGRGGTIHVALHREGEQRARLEVWDDGAGFAVGATEESTRSLGLRLVRTLSRQLDGELTLENRKGAYASLSFALDGVREGRKVA